MKYPSIDEYLLNNFVENSKTIIGSNLVGIYLHGSAVMGCFNPAKSDVDLIVVVKESLPAQVKRSYMDMVVEANTSAPAKGIEMSIVKAANCNPFVYPTPFDLHFSIAHLNWYKENPDDYIMKMNGTDKDLAAHFTIIRARGKCLDGEPIEKVFGQVPKQDYMDSILNDIQDAKKDIAKDTMYLTLNLARVLAYKNSNQILSKKESGEWALENIPEEYATLIQQALQEYNDGVDVVYDTELAQRYAEYMLEQISNTSFM